MKSTRVEVVKSDRCISLPLIGIENTGWVFGGIHKTYYNFLKIILKVWVPWLLKCDIKYIQIMAQHALKNVNNCLNTNINSY